MTSIVVISGFDNNVHERVRSIIVFLSYQENKIKVPSSSQIPQKIFFWSFGHYAPTF